MDYLINFKKAISLLETVLCVAKANNDTDVFYDDYQDQRAWKEPNYLIKTREMIPILKKHMKEIDLRSTFAEKEVNWSKIRGKNTTMTLLVNAHMASLLLGDIPLRKCYHNLYKKDYLKAVACVEDINRINVELWMMHSYILEQIYEDLGCYDKYYSEPRKIKTKHP